MSNWNPNKSNFKHIFNGDIPTTASILIKKDDKEILLKTLNNYSKEYYYLRDKAKLNKNQERYILNTIKDLREYLSE